MPETQALDTKFDADNPARIFPLLSEKGDRALLKDWINKQDDCVFVAGSSPANVEFDLCIVDAKAMSVHHEELYARKQTAAPVLLPYLLLLSENDLSVVTKDGGELADHVLKATIDEIVSLPLKKVELNWRVQALLRLRSQSLRMREKEQTLQEFKEAADSAGNAIYITDTDGSITYVNPAFEEITGFPEAEIVGKKPSILKSGEMPEGYYKRMWETVTAGDVWEEEVINQRKNGDQYHAKQTIAPIIGQDGAVKSYVAIQIDITERKRREETLRQYKQAVESSKDLLAALDEHYKYLFANMEYREYHGVGPVEITDYTLPEVIGKEPFETAKPYVEKALGGEEVQKELSRTHPEKGERTLDVRYFPLKDAEGQIHGVGASMRDITSQKRLQKNLEETKDRYESLFNSIRDAILVTNTDREIINCNPAFVDLFGYELEEIEGKHTKYLYANEGEYQKMGEAIEGHIGDPQFSQQVTYEKQSGQTFPGETNVFYLRNSEDEIVGFIGVIRDVSDREDRLTQLQMIDRILQHNFHNEMNVIQGFAEQIQTEGSPSVRNYAEKIDTSGSRLLDTVEKEREITNFLVDPPPEKAIHVDDICRRIVTEVSETYPLAQIETAYEGDLAIETTGAIERAIEELLTNSIIHSDAERPQVTVTVESAVHEIRITIADQNSSIPEMEREVIVGDEKLSPLFHGSGMGLWLVSLIVKHSDGKLEFGENEPKGNRVSIILPRE